MRAITRSMQRTAIYASTLTARRALVSSLGRVQLPSKGTSLSYTTMSPTLGPTTPLQTPPLGAFHTTAAATVAATTPPLPEPIADVAPQEKGLRHAENVVLDARQYKKPAFAKQVVQLLATLRVSTWTPALAPHAVTIYKVSGSLTNAVFFISHASARTVLLRIYGPSSGELVSRPHELHTLHVLSSQYGIGPRVYGTFANGRVEEYFASSALTAASMRDPAISAWIGRRMAELHGVDLSRVELEPGGGREGVRLNVRRWLGPAREVLRRARERGHPGAAEIDLDGFAAEWERYWAWLVQWERTHGASPRVFAHNDTQYGNLLELDDLRAGAPAHHRIIVVDFEYASPNAAAFDIANHFHEWTADYHGATPHLLAAERYPDAGARRNFYVAYLAQAHTGSCGAVPTEAELEELDEAVRAWSAASHGMWGVWGVVQAAEQVDGTETGEFDYLGYARCRLSQFRAWM